MSKLTLRTRHVTWHHTRTKARCATNCCRARALCRCFACGRKCEGRPRGATNKCHKQTQLCVGKLCKHNKDDQTRWMTCLDQHHVCRWTKPKTEHLRKFDWDNDDDDAYNPLEISTHTHTKLTRTRQVKNLDPKCQRERLNLIASSSNFKCSCCSHRALYRKLRVCVCGINVLVRKGCRKKGEEEKKRCTYELTQLKNIFSNARML